MISIKKRLASRNNPHTHKFIQPMSNISSMFFVAGEFVDIRYESPKFPSLYFPVTRKSSIGSKYESKFTTSYIYYVSDIWKFTLYWCLILYPSAYIVSGIITLYNLLHVHNRIFTKQQTHKENNKENIKKQEGFLTFNISNDGSVIEPSSITESIQLNSSLTSNSIYYLIIFIYLLLYPTIGLVYGVIYGTVMGFLLGVIYRSALFGMSTWVPLCVSCCSLLYTILSSYKLFGFAL